MLAGASMAWRILAGGGWRRNQPESSSQPGFSGIREAAASRI